MEIKNANTVKGLQTIRKANTLILIALVIALVSGVLTSVFILAGINLAPADNTTLISILAILTSGSGFLALIGVILILIARIQEIVGLVGLSKIHNGYKTALILIIVNMALAFVIALLPIESVIISVVTKTLALLSVASVYFIFGATMDLLSAQGNSELVTKGISARMLYVISNVVFAVVSMLALIPTMALIFNILTIACCVAQCVALIKYIGFLNRAATTLKV